MVLGADGSVEPALGDVTTGPGSWPGRGRAQAGREKTRDTSPPCTYRDPMTRAHSDIDVRPITEAELAEWLRAVNTGFLRGPAVTETELEARRGQFEQGRFLGAFDGARCVATFRSFAQELTAVGGTLVAADAVSDVTVTATHRRRGLLTRMMGQDLAGREGARRRRGHPDRRRVPDLRPLRLRPRHLGRRVDGRRPAHRPRPPLVRPRGRRPYRPGGRPRTYASSAPNCTSGVRRARPARSAATTGGGRSTRASYGSTPTWTEPFFAVYRSADGEVEGLVAYEVDDKWGDGKRR